MCMAQIPAPASLAIRIIAGSPSRPVTSLIISAPFSNAFFATEALDVSIDIGQSDSYERIRTTSPTRRHSSSGSTESEKGRVLSPPISRMSAPASMSDSPCATAVLVCVHRPPSEKLSGVVFTIPIKSGNSSGLGRRTLRVRSCHSAGSATCGFITTVLP